MLARRRLRGPGALPTASSSSAIEPAARDSRTSLALSGCGLGGIPDAEADDVASRHRRRRVGCAQVRGSGDALDHQQHEVILDEDVRSRAEIEEAVEAIIGSEPNALVILGTRGPARRMMQEFRSFSKFVPVGSYVVLEDTIVNGNPVWACFGPGPAEAVKGIVESRGDWAADLNMDKYKLTFNPSGFIKRVS